ncbi:four helix bundle protein [Salibacteraceae bacterium]|jgi:four helix bundle protein|nr:four helix bundle protein [Salibacteraceae bacterium]MDB9710073.1 four helix bundle protein [Salibacteraceae bacterium]MDC1304078.1 four helix bundle protein [Salibacteraceae bacterium]
MRNFKTLKVWQLGKEIAVDIFQLATQLDKEIQFVFSSQVTRAAVSISSNIAEGNSRQSTKDYARFLEIALGSAFEVETQILIILDICPDQSARINDVLSKLEEEQKMLFGLLKKLRTPNSLQLIPRY